MTGAISLTSSMEDYLEVVLNLSEKVDVVRITDIANELNITKASVTQAIGTLKKMGLIIQDRYGPVYLSSTGKEHAAKVRYRHRTLRTFLVEVLGVSYKIAEKDACLMEHVLSPHTMEKLVEFLEVNDRRGGPTALDTCSLQGSSESHVQEQSECEEGGKVMRSVNIKSLSELAVGQQGKVYRVAAEGSARRRILEMGVTPGTEITLKGVAPLGDPIEVLVKGYRLSLRKEEADNIFVEAM